MLQARYSTVNLVIPKSWMALCCGKPLWNSVYQSSTLSVLCKWWSAVMLPHLHVHSDIATLEVINPVRCHAKPLSDTSEHNVDTNRSVMSLDMLSSMNTVDIHFEGKTKKFC